MSETQHEWQVGDLCLCTYGGTGHGVVYRVMEAGPLNKDSFRREYQMLTIAPAYACIAKLKGRGKRKIGAGYCTPVSLVDLASEYAKLGHFIADEAKKRGADGST